MTLKEADTVADAGADAGADVDVDEDADGDRHMLHDAAPATEDDHLQLKKIYTVTISKEPPKGFEAAPISDQDVVAKRPSESYRPRKLFDEFSIFKDVDGHSVEVNFYQLYYTLEMKSICFK